MTTPKRKLGDYGEMLAVQYLERQGYTIHTTNWQCRRGELDIVAQSDGTWVFVEVKTRRSEQIAAALMNITPAKRKKLIAAVYAYLNAHDLDDETLWRVDAIAVVVRRHQPPLIEHVEDALAW